MLQGWDIVWVITLLIAALVTASGGFLVASLGLRGRRVGDHPFCRRCEFDLFGLGAESSNCPECGAVLSAPHAIWRGERRRRSGMVTVGAAMLMIGCVAGVPAARMTFGHYQIAANKPVWWLKREMRSAVQTTRLAAAGELGRRRGAGELTERQMRSLALMGPVKVPLAQVTAIDPSGVDRWLPGVCIDAAVDLRRGGKLDDAQWETVCRRIITCSVGVRNPVRHGDLIAFKIVPSWTGVAGTDVTSVRTKTVSATVDDHAAQISAVSWGRTSIPHWSVRGGGYDTGVVTVKPEAWQQIGAGQHRLVVVLWGGVSIGRSGDEQERLTWEGRLEVKAAFDVVPATTATVEMIVEPSLRDAVRQCVAPWTAPGHKAFGTLVLRTPEECRLPIELAFDVYLRQGGKEVFVGSFASQRRFPVFWRLTEIPPGFEPGKVDVLLRPSNDAAAGCFATRQIWGEEVLFEQVELRAPTWPTPAPSSANE